MNYESGTKKIYTELYELRERKTENRGEGRREKIEQVQEINIPHHSITTAVLVT